MKRRDFMKLSAATALSATVAAMAPSALAATELDQTNGDLHTTVDRKTAAMGLGDGKTFAYDPENPYLNVNVGLFHNAQVMVDGQNVGTVTHTCPTACIPWAPAVIVLTPDNTTARAFSGSVTGRRWRTVACKNKIAVAFLVLKTAAAGTFSLSAAGRDDAAALDALYQLMRKKSVKLSGAFSMDKSHTALVGYKEGGAAALLFGTRWASDFSSICAVDAVEVPAASLEAVGGEYVLPFPGDSTRGVQEEAIAAKTVDTPVWFVRSKADTANKAALDFYLNANQAVAKEWRYVSSRAGSAAEVVTEKKAQCPAAIWGKVLRSVQALYGAAAAGSRSKGRGLYPSGL